MNGHVELKVMMKGENAKRNEAKLTFPGTTEQGTVLLEAKVEVDGIRISERL